MIAEIAVSPGSRQWTPKPTIGLVRSMTEVDPKETLKPAISAFAIQTRVDFKLLTTVLRSRMGSVSTAAGATLLKRASSILWQSGNLEASEINVFVQGANLRQPQIFGPQMSDAHIMIIITQPAGLGELSGAKRGLSFKGMGGRKARVDVR